MNLSTDNILVVTANEEVAELVKEVLIKFFEIKASINLTEFAYLNWCIIQSVLHITMDQADYITKMYKQYFKGYTLMKCDILFHIDNKVKDEFVTSVPYLSEDLNKLKQ